MGYSTVTSQEELAAAAAAAAIWTTLPRDALQISPASHMGVHPPRNLLPPGSHPTGQAQTQPRVDSGYSTDPHRLAAWHPLRPLCRFQSKEDRRTRAQSQHG